MPAPGTSSTTQLGRIVAITCGTGRWTSCGCEPCTPHSIMMVPEYIQARWFSGVVLMPRRLPNAAWAAYGLDMSLSWVKEPTLALVAKKIKFCRSYKPMT